MKWSNRVPLLLSILLITACQQNPYKQGERLYQRYCANCHMEQGQGMASLYPPLNTPEFTRYTDVFACIIREGMNETMTVAGNEYIFPMPAIPELNNVEISNIYNFIIHEWHTGIPPKTAIQVESELKDCTK